MADPIKLCSACLEIMSKAGVFQVVSNWHICQSPESCSCRFSSHHYEPAEEERAMLFAHLRLAGDALERIYLNAKTWGPESIATEARVALGGIGR